MRAAGTLVLAVGVEQWADWEPGVELDEPTFSMPLN
jgi:hypothetical protein